MMSMLRKIVIWIIVSAFMLTCALSMGFAENVTVDVDKIAAMRAYNVELAKGNPYPENVQVLDLLEPGALLGNLEVPTIGVNMTVRYGTTIEVLEDDLGVLEGSSLPAGGKGSHVAISGHTGTMSKRMLTDLTLVEEGDIFFFHTFGLNMAYQVDNIAVVLPSENKLLAIDPNEDYMTLITCVPYGVNSHRLLVRGKRIDYDFSKSAEEQGLGDNVKRRYSVADKLYNLLYSSHSVGMSEEQFKSLCVKFDYGTVAEKVDQLDEQLYVITVPVSEKQVYSDGYLYVCQVNGTDAAGKFVNYTVYIIDHQDMQNDSYHLIQVGELIKCYGTVWCKSSDEIYVNAEYVELFGK